MAETTIESKERLKLKPSWVGEWQPLREGSDIKVKRFNCEGYEYQFQTFKKILGDHLKANVEFDGEVELRVTVAGENTYKNHTLIEIYENDKPISETKSQTRRYAGRDEERVDERTAIMEIGADYRADKRDKDDALVEMREWWLRTRLEPKPKEVKKSTSINPEQAEKSTEGFNTEWWKENLEATNYMEWLPQILAEFNIVVKATRIETYIQRLKSLEPSQRQLIEIEVNQRLKS